MLRELIVQALFVTQSRRWVLHLTELRLNSQLTNRKNAGIFLAFRGDQPVADINHRFDLQSESGELRPQAIDVNVKAFGIERLIAAPN